MFFIAFYKNSFSELFSALLVYFSTDSLEKFPYLNYKMEPILIGLWEFIKDPIKSCKAVVNPKWESYYQKYLPDENKTEDEDLKIDIQSE